MSRHAKCAGARAPSPFHTGADSTYFFLALSGHALKTSVDSSFVYMRCAYLLWLGGKPCVLG